MQSTAFFGLKNYSQLKTKEKEAEKREHAGHETVIFLSRPGETVIFGALRPV